MVTQDIGLVKYGKKPMLSVLNLEKSLDQKTCDIIHPKGDNHGNEKSAGRMEQDLPRLQYRT